MLWKRKTNYRNVRLDITLEKKRMHSVKEQTRALTEHRPPSRQLITPILTGLPICLFVYVYCISHVWLLLQRQRTELSYIGGIGFQSAPPLEGAGVFIPLSHYSKNVLRTYYEHKMSKFVVKSARIFSFFPNLRTQHDRCTNLGRY